MNPITTTVPADGKISLSSDLAGQKVFVQVLPNNSDSMDLSKTQLQSWSDSNDDIYETML